MPASEHSDPPQWPTGSLRLWFWTLGAGVVAGLAAWLGGEACVTAFRPPLHAVRSKTVVLNVADRREAAVADAKNAGLAFALLGGVFGAAMGAAGGLARRCARSAAGAAILGLVLGVSAAALLSLAVLPRYNAYKARYPDAASSDLFLPLLVHAAVWSAIGAAGGVALASGLGVRRLLPALAAGGLLGAALGAVGYEITGALLFPAAGTARFVSATWQTRLLARLAVTVPAAAGAVLGAFSSPRRDNPGAT
jgi:hypothetical protein